MTKIKFFFFSPKKGQILPVRNSSIFVCKGIVCYVYCFLKNGVWQYKDHFDAFLWHHFVFFHISCVAGDFHAKGRVRKVVTRDKTT